MVANKEKLAQKIKKRTRGRIEIYRQAWQKYGATSQCVVAMEECSELIKELSKAIRGEANGLHLAEEIADVEIMLEQIKLHFSIGIVVQGFKIEKIKRLNQRLNQNKGGNNGK